MATSWITQEKHLKQLTKGPVLEMFSSAQVQKTAMTQGGSSLLSLLDGSTRSTLDSTLEQDWKNSSALLRSFVALRGTGAARSDAPSSFHYGGGRAVCAVI